MQRTPNFLSKEVALNIERLEEIQPVFHALSTELRLKIIRCIAWSSKSVNELARELDMPVSTVALNVQVLEKAGLIVCDTQPGVRGTLKLCSRRIDQIMIDLVPEEQPEVQRREFSMPVGGFIRVGDVAPTCGLAAAEGPFGMDDMPEEFYSPNRFRASLMWMREGFVEYAFPKLNAKRLESLEFSFEACSEAPFYNMDWPSDIYVRVNGVEIGVWHCPSDFGGRRGRLNPAWWGDSNSQYGQLKTWRISCHGTTLDGVPLSGVGLDALNLESGDYITLTIGARKLAGHAGGLNLFGKNFGDYPQDIRMCAEFK